MFDEFFGLPLHVLVIHAAVVLVPATALLGIAYAVLPKWRWLARWPLVLAAAGSVVTVFVAIQAGQELRDRLYPEQAPPLVDTHESRGELLLYVLLAYAVVAVVAAFMMGGPSSLKSEAGARDGQAKPIQLGLAVVLVAMSIAITVLVVLTGDAGTRSHWQQFGFSSESSE